jgi:hypothetical protein
MSGNARFANMHKDLRRAASFKTPKDRTFGYVMVGVFVVVALSPMLRRPTEPPRFWALMVAIIFALLATLWTVPLKPLNRLWTCFGLRLHRIVNLVVFGVILFVIIMPIGLMMRLVGKDPLKLRSFPADRSYWIERTPDPSPQSMKQQF